MSNLISKIERMQRQLWNSDANFNSSSRKGSKAEKEGYTKAITYADQLLEAMKNRERIREALEKNKLMPTSALKTFDGCEDLNQLIFSTSERNYHYDSSKARFFWDDARGNGWVDVINFANVMIPQIRSISIKC